MKREEEVTQKRVTNNDNEECTMYASDSDATDLLGYKKLLSKYPYLEDGANVELEYDFSCKEYEQLLNTYHIKEIAGDGSEFKRAVRLMDYFAPRLTHKPDYDNHVKDNAIDLLKYSMNQENHGINCRAKTKILNEMCLALGIYARRVWLHPYSSRDADCHVVSEIYDTSYKKWILIDMTTDCYFIDKNELPLSVLELRQCGVDDEDCTAIDSRFALGFDAAVTDPDYIETTTYFMKNMFSIEVQKQNGFGWEDKKTYVIIPSGFDVGKRNIACRKFTIQYGMEHGFDQALMDSMKKSLAKEEAEGDHYEVISPEVMRKRPV